MTWCRRICQPAESCGTEWFTCLYEMDISDRVLEALGGSVRGGGVQYWGGVWVMRPYVEAAVHSDLGNEPHPLGSAV